jgi:hypothetical protein
MTNTANVSKSKAVNVINQASSNLAYELDNIKWSKLYTDYLKENINEEKVHDNYRGESIQILSRRKIPRCILIFIYEEVCIHRL